MRKKTRASATRYAALALMFVTLIFGAAPSTTAHPLGNFTINHFTRLEIGRERVRVHFVVDMAEIPSFQELQAADADGDGKSSEAELGAYLEHASRQYADG